MNPKRRNEIAYEILKARLRKKEIRLGGINEWSKQMAERTNIEPAEMRSFSVEIIAEVAGEALAELSTLETVPESGDAHEA